MFADESGTRPSGFGRNNNSAVNYDMFADESGTRPSGFGRNNNSAVNYDYNTSNIEKNNYYVRTPSFNGDTKFSWWKSQMYNHIIGVDDELWDIMKMVSVFLWCRRNGSKQEALEWGL
jgi:hypothetical protein